MVRLLPAVVSLTILSTQVLGQRYSDLISSLSRSSRTAAAYPFDPDWDELTSRISAYSIPNITVVIPAATVPDVEKIVSYAHKNRIPLHPITSTHGSTISLREIENGIQLNLRPRFTAIRRVDRTTIEIGGGTKNFEIMEFLDRHKLRTSSGSCDCVGFMGLAMGGGMNKYRGLTGLTADVLKSVDIVTPGQGRITASETRNPEVFWGIKGAGHNLGVVVSARVRVAEWDPKIDGNEWLSAVFFYTPENIEAVAKYLEYWRKEFQAPQVTLFWTYVPTPGTEFPDYTGPLIRLALQTYGLRKDDDATLAPFYKLKPIHSFKKPLVPWKDIAHDTGSGVNDGACTHDMTLMRSNWNAQLSKLSPRALRAAFNYMNETVWPFLSEIGGGTRIVWEIYPNHGMNAVPAESASFAWRKRPILSAFNMGFPVAAGPEVERRAADVARMGVQILNMEEKGLASYLNYGHGDETAEEFYGGGETMERLKRLKRRYDPRGILSGYGPIPLR